MIRYPPCPCNGCTDRYVGCQSNCKHTPSYNEWRREADSISEEVRMSKQIENDCTMSSRSMTNKRYKKGDRYGK